MRLSESEGNTIKMFESWYPGLPRLACLLWGGVVTNQCFGRRNRSQPNSIESRFKLSFVEADSSLAVISLLNIELMKTEAGLLYIHINQRAKTKRYTMIFNTDATLAHPPAVPSVLVPLCAIRSCWKRTRTLVRTLPSWQTIRRCLAYSPSNRMLLVNQFRSSKRHRKSPKYTSRNKRDDVIIWRHYIWSCTSKANTHTNISFSSSRRSNREFRKPERRMQHCSWIWHDRAYSRWNRQHSI